MGFFCFHFGFGFFWGECVGEDVRGFWLLTYVVSIEISFTVTVFCKLKSKGVGGRAQGKGQ